jgi:hypothetical protein
VVLLPELDVHLVGDAERVLEHVQPLGKALAHLGVRLEVEPAVVVHALGILQILPEPDAQQDVVGVVVLRLEEVRVVRGHHREADLGRQLEDLVVELLLPLRVVRLDLEVVPILEQLRVPGGGLAGGVPAVLHQVPGDLAGQARRRDDEPLAVGRQQLAVRRAASRRSLPGRPARRA